MATGSAPGQRHERMFARGGEQDRAACTGAGALTRAWPSRAAVFCSRLQRSKASCATTLKALTEFTEYIWLGSPVLSPIATSGRR